MKVGLNSSTLIRISLIALLVFISVVASIHFVRNISSATDENIFSDTPSRFYLTKEIISYDTTGLSENPKERINPGMLIISIDGKNLNSEESINSILKDSQRKYHKFVFYNTSQRTKVEALVKSREFSSESVSYLPSAVVVLEVNRGGASDRAGMKVGDIIIKINGKQFPNMFIADRFLASEKANELMKYEILRNNELITLLIIPVQFGLPFVFLLLEIAGILMITFGSLVLMKRPEIKTSHFLGFGYILSGAALLLAISRYGLYVKPDTFLILRNLLFVLFFNIGCLLITYSIYLFPVPIKQILDKKWIFRRLIIMSIILISANLLNIFIIKNNQVISFLDSGIIFYILFVVVIRIKYNKYFSEDYKKLNRPIAVSFLILLFVRIAIPLIGGKLNFPILLPNYLFSFSIIALIISYIYVINRYNLLNLNIRLRRNIQYTLLSFVWRLLAILIIGLMLYGISNLKLPIPNLSVQGTNIEILSKPLEPAKQNFYEKLVLVLSGLVFTILFWKFKNNVQRFLDKRFFRNSFDYRKASTDIANLLARNITLKDLTSSITSELAELTLLKRVGIVIFKNETTLVAQDFYGIKNKELFELVSASGVKLAESIKPLREDFGVDLIKEPLGDILKEFGFRYIQPIFSKNKLLGALIIGEKKSESSLNRDDFSFLKTIAGQIAVAIDNSFLYEEITQKERMKHELDIARKIQVASLPNKVPAIPGLDISGVSCPAFEVGGDFYDYLETENGDFMVIVGDVSGKGTSAALYMSKIQGIMRTLHEFRLSPRKLLVRTNNLLYNYLEKGYFVSATVVNFKTDVRKASISRAGHLPLYYFSTAQNKLSRLIPKGMVLGLTKDKTFERNMDEDEISYSAGDLFVFISDGILDSKNSLMQDYGEERLIRTINSTVELSAEAVKNAIIESARIFAGDEEQFDDMTVVVVKILE